MRFEIEYAVRCEERKTEIEADDFELNFDHGQVTATFYVKSHDTSKRFAVVTGITTIKPK